MIFSKLKLKFLYPHLKSFNINELGGIYSHNALDLILLKFAYNNLRNSNSISIIEVDKPSNANFSFSNIFIELFSANFFLINSKLNSILYFGSDSLENNQENLPIKSEFENFGVSNKFKGNVIKSSYLNLEDLKNKISISKDDCLILSINYSFKSVNILESLLEFNNSNFIVIQNNNDGFFSSGNDEIRKKIQKNGYVFFARINNSDDLFVSLELINGFPREAFKTLKSSSLLKWVSIPKNNDYTKPM